MNRPPLRTARWLLLFGILAPPLQGGEWLTDFEDAKKRARNEDKDLLVQFTGSDWCSWCIRLEREVFALEDFKKEAGKRFVLVELDYPRQKEQPEETTTQNEKLKKTFGITLWPTVYLLDAEGRPYGKTGYEAGGPEKYLEHLDVLRKRKEARDRALEKASGATGLERARHLDEALSAVEDDGVLIGYDRVVAEILELDGDNQGGLKFKYSSRPVRIALRGGDIDGALERLTRLMGSMKLEGASKQDAYYLKATALNQKQDLQGTIVALRVALEAAPKSPRAKDIRAMIRILEED